MQEVDILGGKYPSYASVEQADRYANASIAADDWDATPTADRGRALVEATRLLDRQTWLSPFHDAGARAVSDRVRDACIEIAVLIAGGAGDALLAGSTNDLIKRLRAGTVEIEYSGKSNAAQRFPATIAELLRGMVSVTTPPAGVALGGGSAFGTGGVSTIGDSYGVTRG